MAKRRKWLYYGSTLYQMNVAAKRFCRTDTKFKLRLLQLKCNIFS